MRTSTEEDDAPLADCPTAANHVALAAISVLEPKHGGDAKSDKHSQTADPVLLPSYQELARLASHPPRREDRLLILLIAWAGLRWSEAVGLSVSDVWPERPKLSVRRIFVWDDEVGGWQVEQVKGGNAATVPLPTPLRTALLELAETRAIEDRPGGDLLFRPTRYGRGMKPTMTIDHTDWSKRVWYPARKAAGLTGDLTLPELDPRRRALHIKDLRAYAASVVVDSGGTQYEAAALLRHSDVMTTNRYYARAQNEKSHDHERARLRVDMDLTLPQRIDALWAAWCTAHPEHTAGLLTTRTDRRPLRQPPARLPQPSVPVGQAAALNRSKSSTNLAVRRWPPMCDAPARRLTSDRPPRTAHGHIGRCHHLGGTRTEDRVQPQERAKDRATPAPDRMGATSPAAALLDLDRLAGQLR